MYTVTFSIPHGVIIVIHALTSRLVLLTKTTLMQQRSRTIGMLVLGYPVMLQGRWNKISDLNGNVLFTQTEKVVWLRRKKRLTQLATTCLYAHTVILLNRLPLYETWYFWYRVTCKKKSNWQSVIIGREMIYVK